MQHTDHCKWVRTWVVNDEVVVDGPEPEVLWREVFSSVPDAGHLSELEEGGFVTRDRVGLRNRYRFKTNVALRHPIEAHCKIGDLISMVEGKSR